MQRLISVSWLVFMVSAPLFSQTSVRTSGPMTPNPVRKANDPMTAAIAAKTPNFILPDKYKDRVKYPLPPIFNLPAVSPYFAPYNPNTNPGLTTEQGMSCANWQAGWNTYNHEANRVTNFKTPTGINTPQYSYEYIYHFLNGGDMFGGDFWMSFTALDLLKETGGATTADFGGLEWGNAFGGWMSGYDKYYRAMKVRLDQYYKIDATQAGSEELVKQVLLDHANGSPFGTGLLTHVSFSANIVKETISGRLVFSSYGAGGGHCIGIVGWDDQFQPEKGGSWIIYDSYAKGLSYSPRNNWKKGGTLDFSNIGVGAPLLFSRAKENYSPKVTLKVTITHNLRGNIAVMTGVGGPTSTAPTAWKDYAGAFNYAGGQFPMVGRNQSSTLEFGLDMTDFSQYLADPNQKLYLMVYSKGGVGKIDKVSIMDYTGGAVQEFASTELNKDITAGSSGTPALTQIAISWPGKVVSISRKDPSQKSKLNAAWIQSGLVRARVNYATATQATMNIRDMEGRVVYTSHMNLRAISMGSYIDFPWAMTRQGGTKVSQGLYFASVNILKGEEILESSTAKILVDK